MTGSITRVVSGCEKNIGDNLSEEHIRRDHDRASRFGYTFHFHLFFIPDMKKDGIF